MEWIRKVCVPLGVDENALKLVTEMTTEPWVKGRLVRWLGAKASATKQTMLATVVHVYKPST